MIESGKLDTQCNNCGKQHGTVDACLLGVLFRVVEDRTGVDFSRMAHLIDADELWERWAGPAADWLESEIARLDPTVKADTR